MSIDISSTLSSLSHERPVFHSEADFQHALAWRIQEDHDVAQVRLEYRPIPEESKSLDVRIVLGDIAAAVELKHLTKALDATVNGERFVLRNQGAHDISAYDCCKDLRRLESFVDAGVARVGYLVVLTNDPLYWKPPVQRGAGYDAFRLFDGRSVAGTLKWGDRAGPGTRRGREAPIELRGEYELRWLDYSRLSEERNGEFRALVVEVSADVAKGGVATLGSPSTAVHDVGRA